MSRYIDAEKLIAEIEKLLAKAKADEEKAFAKKDAAGHLAAVTKTTVCVKIKKLIATLQQQERTCTTCGFYENNCPFIRGKVCKDYTYSVMKEQPQVADASKMEQPEVDKQEYGPYARQYPKSKVSQEQPEVDLEKEIEKCLKQHQMLAVGKKDFTDIAHYFYELGLNARKEK